MKDKKNFSFFLVYLTFLWSLLSEPNKCSMFLLVNGIQKYNSTSTRNAKNLELIDNYSIILPNDNYLKIRLNLNSKDFEKGNSFDKNCLGLQHSIYHHFHRADVCLYGVYYYDYFIELSRMHDDYVYPPAINHSLQIYEKIVLGFSHHVQYGHFMHDMLCPIISMPAEILNDAEIFVCFNENEARNIFNFLGFDPNHVHALTNQWVHGIDVHATVSSFGVNAMFKSWIDLHHLIYKKYNLYDIEPTLFTAINKPGSNWGYIGNFDSLIERAKELYPEYNWTLYPAETLFNIEFTAKLLAATKLFISAPGSTCFNCIYMHPNTHILFFSRLLPDNPALASALTLGIYVYSINSPNLKHVFMIDFDNGLHEIMYVVKHGQWGNGVKHRSKLLFDFSFYEKGYDLYRNVPYRKGSLEK